MMHDELLIEQLLQKSDDQLLEEIGEHLHGTLAFPATPKQLVEIGRHWMDVKRNELARLICVSQRIRKIATQEADRQERIVLIAAIADLISQLVIDVSPLTVSVLLVRQGLNRLCAEHWTRDSHSKEGDG